MNIMPKRLFCIRHGEALHNAYFHLFGRSIYYDKMNVDTKLTDKGVKQSIKLGNNWKDKNKIDLVITSPLMRCLQTTSNIFKGRNVPIIAFEYAREFPMGLQYCNKRSKREELEKKYPYINFKNLGSNLDLMWNQERYETMNELNFRKDEVMKFIKNRSEKNIALVSHSGFLMNFLYDYLNEDESKELDYCTPFEKIIEDT